MESSEESINNIFIKLLMQAKKLFISIFYDTYHLQTKENKGI